MITYGEKEIRTDELAEKGEFISTSKTKGIVSFRIVPCMSKNKNKVETK